MSTNINYIMQFNKFNKLSNKHKKIQSFSLTEIFINNYVNKLC